MKGGPIGLGATVLARGAITGQLDGIGIYSGNMLKGLRERLGDSRVHPVVFGKYPWAQPHVAARLPFRMAAPAMALPGVSYPGSAGWARKLSLFHAPDHYVPRLRSTPVVATVMDIIPLRHPEWVSRRLTRHAMNWLFARLVRSADHVITISDFSAADIAEGLGMPAARITAIPLGVDDYFFERPDAATVQATLDRHELRAGFFLFVGTLQPRKNLGRLLRAHASLPEGLRREHPLVVVGRSGWGSDELLLALEQAVAKGSCKWLRYVSPPDLRVLLGQARALVFPSLFEGFGLPVLEAFAAGAAVVTSSTTSIPEVAGDAALLVNPTSVDELRQAMLDIAQNTALRERLVRLGSERALRFSWAATVAATLDVYRKFTEV